MKIKNIKINSFGGLNNTEIELTNGINLISGKNESGKSTILKFISAMFYGISKNKNGKELSDFDKYKPWSKNEFSGKIKYKLDNNETIEVYRDFTKKMPKIYNEDGEEITERYNADKVKGSSFFIDQTGINEDLLINTAVVEQSETQLNKIEQLTVLQKISNVLSTGKDNVSYKKVLEKLKEKQLVEIGTERTIERPINIIKRELKLYKEKLAKINSYKIQVESYENDKVFCNEQIIQLKNQILLMKSIKTLKEDLLLEQEKINITKKDILEFEEKRHDIEQKEENIKNIFVSKKNNRCLFVFVFLVLGSVISNIIVNNLFILIFGLIISLCFLGLQININLKNQKTVNEKDEKLASLNKEKELIEDSLKRKENEKNKQEKEYNLKEIERNNNLKIEYKDKIDIYLIEQLLNRNLDNIKYEITIKEEQISSFKLKLNTLAIRYKTILEELEELPEIEEKISEYVSQEQELILLNNSINLARITLEESYKMMKENITPEFTKNLSEIVNKISNSKYTNIKFNDIDGLIVELENGNYINADKLSIGTIDQMYLALRLSVLKEVSLERMPLILDESFVYYDNERLKNILNFLNKEYGDNQIILFSCNERESKMLNNLDIKYNLQLLQ